LPELPPFLVVNFFFLLLPLPLTPKTELTELNRMEEGEEDEERNPSGLFP